MERAHLLEDVHELPASQRLMRLLSAGPEKIIRQLKGNFAVVIIERRGARLWARRDSLGAHSLYFARRINTPDWIVGNSAAEVFRASGNPFEVDPEYIVNFFSSTTQQLYGRSAFLHVSALLPGEVLFIKGPKLIRQHVPMALLEPPAWTTESEAVEQFQGLLQNSIRNCLRDAEIAAVMLSGGLDSGPLAVIGDYFCRKDNRRLVPISWSLKEFPEADESDWVDEVAKGLSHPLVRLECSDLLPFTNPGAAPVNPEGPAFNVFRPVISECYRAARKMHCSVILNGAAGDDLYPGYRLLYRGYIAHQEWSYLFDDLKGSFKRGGWRALWTKNPLRELVKHPLRRFIKPSPPAWLTEQGRKYWRPTETWPPECKDHPIPEFAEQILSRLMGSGLAEEFFEAAKWGMERRDPFQNEELAKFMLAAPFSFSIRHHRTKWIMREAMKGRLPEPVRLKRRTGLLRSYYHAGELANRQSIATLLFETNTDWQRWVSPDAVRGALAGDLLTGPKGLMLSKCIGYVNWLRYWH